jgi:hypothetical protein
MRQKSYYPTAEIKLNLYTTGSEWQTIDGVEYIGLYHMYATGEAYTEPNWVQDKSKKLVKYITTTTRDITYSTLKPSIVSKSITPLPTIPSSTTNTITRYFIQRYDSLPYEIDITQYQQWISNSIDRVIYTAVAFEWVTSGPINDTVVNGTLQLGVRSKNQKSVKLVANTMPRLTDVITNFTEFYNNSANTPKDINK